MLADPRSKALVDQLRRAVAAPAQSQELRRRIWRRSPTSTTTCGRRCSEETELFFDSIMREDRSVAGSLNADYTFVNERLARHYGIPNVYGSQFRRVTVADEARRGLLGQAQHPHRHLVSESHVAGRARQVDPDQSARRAAAAAAAECAAAARRTAADGKVLSLRERMEQHRANPVCAGCHKVMDPIGFALENFDGIGRWRTKDDGVADRYRPARSSTAPRSTASSGCAGSSSRQPEIFVGVMTEKMLTYALGRGLEYYDMPAVRKIVRDAAEQGFPFLIDRAGHRPEHAVSDEGGHSELRSPGNTFRAGRSSRRRVSRCRCRSSNRWCRR